MKKLLFTDYDRRILPAIHAKGKLMEYHGMERSGHFAFLYWLHCQMPHPTCHAGRFHLPERSKCRWWFEEGTPKYMTVSYKRDNDLEAHKQIYPNIPTIILVRDVKNMFASRFKMVGADAPMCQPYKLIIWKQYAKAVLSEWQPFDNYIGVFYDQWFKSKKYRKEIIEAINGNFKWDLKFTDDGIDRVSPIGHGSSFDNMKFDGKAQDMDVLNRWKQEPGILDIIPKHILELNKKLQEL